MLRRKKFYQLLLAVMACSQSMLYVTQANASSAETSPQEFRDFAGLRTEILAKVGAASQRIWLATDFLTDAEIVSSLFIAQYRKINISVLLGKDRATNILSRLNYLKQVNIPVALRPKDFYAKYPTIVLIDNQIYGVSINLDYMTRASRASVEVLGSEVLREFEARFIAAAKLQNAPQMPPLPQVGRARPNSRYYKAKESARPAPTLRNPADNPDDRSPTTQNHALQPHKTESSKANAGDRTKSGQAASYRYRSGREKAPEGIPTRLPKTTLRQELQRERERLRNVDRDNSSTAE